MQFPRIHSRRHLADQARENVTPVDDATLGRRVPVEVLRNQMAMYGMHSPSNNHGYTKLVIQQLAAKGISIKRQSVPCVPSAPYTPPPKKPNKPKPKSNEELVAEAFARGMVTVQAMCRELCIRRATLSKFVQSQGLTPMVCGKYRLYWREELAKYRKTPARGMGVTLPDGREFDSLNAVAHAYGIKTNTLLYRLKQVGEGVTGEAVWKAVNWQPRPAGRRAKKVAA